MEPQLSPTPSPITPKHHPRLMLNHSKPSIKSDSSLLPLSTWTKKSINESLWYLHLFVSFVSKYSVSLRFKIMLYIFKLWFCLGRIIFYFCHSTSFLERMFVKKRFWVCLAFLCLEASGYLWSLIGYHFFFFILLMKTISTAAGLSA